MLKAFNTSAAVDYIATMSAMDATSFTLNYTDAATSAILIHYLAIGGSDVTKAKVGSFQAAISTATQNVTIAASLRSAEPAVHDVASKQRDR